MFFYVVVYALYPYHGLSYGPRFYFEIVPLLFIFSARGLMLLGQPRSRMPGLTGKHVRNALLAMVVISFGGVLPGRLKTFHARADFYDLTELLDQVRERPALVFIDADPKARLLPYMAGFQLNDPDLENSVIFARDRGEENRALIDLFPRRSVYLLDMDDQTVRSVARYKNGPPIESGRAGRQIGNE